MAFKAVGIMIYHDSRNVVYRWPAGARPAGDEITLRLKVEDMTEFRAYARIWHNNAERLYIMEKSEGGLMETRVRLPEEPGLVWYYFIVEEGGMTYRYGNDYDLLGGEGALWDAEPPSFQVTVYARDFNVPEWMRGGIMYQIMPDRFYEARQGIGDRPPQPYGYYHESWYESPVLNIDHSTGDNMANDFFGGNLRGIIEKLPYLESLGVTAIYLNPIFKARSNHKYDVGDYKSVDPSFGNEDDFTGLCAGACERGIRVMLDGVFSHTGDDSLYFNRYGHYDSVGAYESLESQYAGWYKFDPWLSKYECWWGFPSLPSVNELCPGYMDFIITGQDAVAVRWLNRGALGWRLDVADELPMDFLRSFRNRVKRESPESAMIGEVWDDASNKVAYGEHRSYCLGDTLDGVTNYPLRDMLISFMLGQTDALLFKRRLDSLIENYPEPFLFSLMNILGSHDKPRIINVLAGTESGHVPRGARRAYVLSDREYCLGRRRFIAAWRFLCSLPGMPCLYYGDEAGSQGGDDPFCRGTYPWGREDTELLAEIAGINRIRRGSRALRDGKIKLIAPDADVIAAVRWLENGDWTLCALNRSPHVKNVRVERQDAPELTLNAPVELILGAQSTEIYNKATLFASKSAACDTE